ncbi:hypothetical protein BDV40DRAFT_279384 [Aspergillus tamarii]|uniref:Uncharacterized protein n=1 Tax=Aspergillus tamarii TaxID=41984 RepID=A0A5N6UEK7_ASPTM|nr:hypothetical protein BDV40DRAFT_279384 [Aspergillus tamarii]
MGVTYHTNPTGNVLKVLLFSICIYSNLIHFYPFFLSWRLILSSSFCCLIPGQATRGNFGCLLWNVGALTDLLHSQASQTRHPRIIVHTNTLTSSDTN